MPIFCFDVSWKKELLLKSNKLLITSNLKTPHQAMRYAEFPYKLIQIIKSKHNKLVADRKE